MNDITTAQKTLLDKQRAKLVELEQKADALFSNAPWVGHGGTPFVDNSRGRQRRGQCDRYNESISSVMKAIEEQKEKIERTMYRDTPVQTKKSEQFIERNPINPILLRLLEVGKVTQWVKNPQFFFVKGLTKVALISVGDRVGVAARFPAKNDQEKALCKELLNSATPAL